MEERKSRKVFNDIKLWNRCDPAIGGRSAIRIAFGPARVRQPGLSGVKNMSH